MAPVAQRATDVGAPIGSPCQAWSPERRRTTALPCRCRGRHSHARIPCTGACGNTWHRLRGQRLGAS
eukprot:5641069-Alexandrium_andersonii.AAC.1